MPAPAISDSALTDPKAFREAVEAFRERVPMTDEQWEALEASAQERAFKVAGVAQAEILADVWDELDRAIEQGTTFEDFKDAIGEKLEGAWQGSVANPAWRMQTIFRTNVGAAYSAGRHRQITDPVVVKHRPFWRFIGVDDNRQTDICHARDGVTLPADDPWWDGNYPLLHFNCRSTILTLDEEDVEREGGIKRPGNVPPVPSGFGAAPRGAAGAWSPDVDAYPPELADILREKLGGVELTRLFDESKVHRGQPRNAGQFAPSGSGGGGDKDTPAETPKPEKEPGEVNEPGAEPSAGDGGKVIQSDRDGDLEGARAHH